jgi:hypothetical protein
MQAAPIEGDKLKSWAVLPGGNQISLDFVAIDGETHRIVLPVDALSGLMMTLPRMLQSALDEPTNVSRMGRCGSCSDWENGNWNSKRSTTI